MSEENCTDSIKTKYDLSFWKGNDDGYRFTFYDTYTDEEKVLSDLTGCQIVFRAVNTPNTMVFRKDLPISDPPTLGYVDLVLTPEETRQIRLGMKYEIEIRIPRVGDDPQEVTLLYGSIIAGGGINDDGNPP